MKKPESIIPAESVPATPTAATSAVATIATPATLPDGYLRDGYFATTDKAKYLHPDYVGDFAQKIADSLRPMKPSDFASLLREMKRNKKRSLPFGARKTALLGMLPKTFSLVHRKKAPQILSKFVNENIAAIHNDEEWDAFYQHCEAILGYLYKTEVPGRTAEIDGGQGHAV